MNKIVYLDRDGTINVEKNYLIDPKDFEFINGSDKAIKLLKDNGYKVVVVTNQAGVARGYYSEEDVIKLHEYINKLLSKIGTSIDKFYYCPHHPVAGIGYYKRICPCRKPGTQMLEKAAKTYDIDVDNSYMIGDNMADMAAGNSFGVKTILVGTGYGKSVKERGAVKYDFYADNLLEAAEYIINTEKYNKKSDPVKNLVEKERYNKEEKVSEILNNLIKRYPILKVCKKDILKAYDILKNSYSNNGKLLIAGNGGSAADAEHIVGELMKGFVKTRPVNDSFRKKLLDVNIDYGKELADKLQMSLPAIALTAQEGVATAFLNDVDGSLIYAQLVNGYGNSRDVYMGISTSGNSKNILAAAVTAKAKGMEVIGLTGIGGGKLKEISDAAICVPETETYKIQELHLPVYHALCLMLEETFY